MTEQRKTNVKNRMDEAHAKKRKSERVAMGFGTPMQDHFKKYHREGYSYFSPVVDDLNNLIELKEFEDAYYVVVRDDAGAAINFRNHVLIEIETELRDEDRDNKLKAIEMSEDPSIRTKKARK